MFMLAGFSFSLKDDLIFGAEPGLSWLDCFLTDDEIVPRFLIAKSPTFEFILGDEPLGMGAFGPARLWLGIVCCDMRKPCVRWWLASIRP